MFAKILDSEKLGQILVTKEYNSEGDASVVVITFKRQEMLLKSSIGVNTVEQQVEVFEAIDLKKAEEILRQVMPFDL